MQVHVIRIHNKSKHRGRTDIYVNKSDGARGEPETHCNLYILYKHRGHCGQWARARLPEGWFGCAVKYASLGVFLYFVGLITSRQGLNSILSHGIVPWEVSLAIMRPFFFTLRYIISRL